MTISNAPPAPIANIPHLRRSLYAALGGTLLLRTGGGVMGILTGLFLAAKNTELGGATHPYHISATMVGIITASFFITELLGSFVAGRLIDQHGPRRYMILGPVFGAIAMLITGVLHLNPDSAVWQFYLFLGLLLAARLLEGSSAAAANPASLAYIAAYTSDNPKLRSRISGIFELCTLIGAIVGIVIGGRLWDRFGQPAFLINIAFYLASAGIFLSVHSGKTATNEASSHNVGAYIKLIESPRLRELIPAWLAVTAFLGVLFNHSTFQLSNARSRLGGEGGARVFMQFPDQTLSHAFSGGQIGMVFGLYAVAFAIGIGIWTLIMPRMRKSTVMLISGVGIVVASIFILLLNHTGPIQEPSTLRLILIPFLLIAVMVESGFTPAALIYLSDLSELHPANRGMIMGLYSFLFGFGQLAGTIMAGPFADQRGIDGLLLFMGILGIASILSVFLLRRDEVTVRDQTTAVSAAK